MAPLSSSERDLAGHLERREKEKEKEKTDGHERTRASTQVRPLDRSIPLPLSNAVSFLARGLTKCLMLEKVPDAGEQSSRLKLGDPVSIRRLLAKPQQQDTSPSAQLEPSRALMATKREINSMRKDTARPASRRQSSISMLSIPVITLHSLVWHT